MTLIEDREAFEPRLLGKVRVQELENSGRFEESGSDDEYSIANEGYGDIGENNNNRDFFSLPTLGLNYLNNLNLSLNLNLNLRNSSLWRIYENSSFPKTTFLSSYLGKHEEGDLDDITSDSRGYSTVANFLRHAFQSYEEDYSDEAILERIRWKELQLQRQQETETGEIFRESEFIPEQSFHINEEDRELFASESVYEEVRVESAEPVEEEAVLQKRTILPEVEVNAETPEDMSNASPSPPTLNPFYCRREMSVFTYLRLVIFFPLLLVKVLMMVFILILALLLSLAGMAGVTFEESQTMPLSAWRRGIRWVLANIVMRSFVLAFGFLWNIRETGKPASPQEAPLFVVGPHSTFFDSFVVILLGAPSVVAKLSTKDVPIFGRLVTFTQAAYVTRESKGGRKQTMETLIERARGVYRGSGLPQLFIFPEGTCSNRSSLIKFKVGAFAPGVPVQPVLIRYPDNFDTVTWTFDGPAWYLTTCLSLTQLYTRIDIEYLPVYVPSDAEKLDAKLYAENVRRVMADALDIPTTDFLYEDGNLLCEMRETKLIQKLKSIYRAKKALGLSGSAVESATILKHALKKVDFNREFQQFQREFFQVTSPDITVPEVQTVFNSFKKNEDDAAIDIRAYLILSCILFEDKTVKLSDIPRRMCELYYPNAMGNVSQENVKKMMIIVFETAFREPLKGVISTGKLAEIGEDGEKRQLFSINDVGKMMSRNLDFAKLFADEVADRLPKTYPSRNERDKLPNMSQKKSN